MYSAGVIPDVLSILSPDNLLLYWLVTLNLNMNWIMVAVEVGYKYVHLFEAI